MGETQKIIVDGYNVIYADDTLRRTAIKDMEKARDMFIARIKTYLADKRLQVTVVFDGRGGIVDAEAIVPGKLQVVYSSRYRSADDVIVSMIQESGNPRAYMVVTSDKAHIRPTATRLGCEVIGSRRFLDRLGQKTPSPTALRDEEKPQPESEDTDFWLDQFGRGNSSDHDR